MVAGTKTGQKLLDTFVFLAHTTFVTDAKNTTFNQQRISNKICKDLCILT